MRVHDLAMRRARAYLWDCLGYLGIAALEIPLGVAALRAPLASSRVFRAVASSLPPVAAALVAARAESGAAAATVGKRREGLKVEAAAGVPEFTRALARNTIKIALPWTLGHTVAFGAADGAFARRSPVTLTAAVATYALVGSTVALGTFGSGRALHDLAAATRVVSVRPPNPGPS
jgi:uncharacterized RDD family membrane protein YckC